MNTPKAKIETKIFNASEKVEISPKSNALEVDLTLEPKNIEELIKKHN